MVFETYDRMTGPELDRSLWRDFVLAGVPRIEPDAVTTVGDGAVTVDVPAFRNGDDSNQGMDNTKHIVVSTREFTLPAKGPARFAVDVEVDRMGAEGDYRLGVASFNVFGGSKGQVFNLLSTEDRVYVEHELLAPDGFTRIIESPFAVVGSGFRTFEVEIDRRAGRVMWRVDGALIHEAAGLTDIVEAVTIGYQIVTLVPLGSPGGSLRGQGASATWRNFRFDLGDDRG